MQASLFFRIIRHGRKIYARERNTFLADLCDIGVIPHAFENYNASKEMFMNRAFPKKKKVMRLDDPNSAMIVEAMFRSIPPNAMRGPNG